jgi:hypothetical protein
MTYTRPTSEYAADALLLKLLLLQNRLLRAIGHLDRRAPVRELHVVFKASYVYDYITKLCMTQAEVILNHVYGIGQEGETMHRTCKRLKFGGCRAYNRSGD